MFAKILGFFPAQPLSFEPQNLQQIVSFDAPKLDQPCCSNDSPEFKSIICEIAILQFCYTVIICMTPEFEMCNVTNYPDFVYNEHCVILSVDLV